MLKLSEDLLDGVWFKDRVDPSDDRFRIIETRIPMEPSLRHGYKHVYVGCMVVQRLRRFAAGFLEATQDITHAHAQRILKSVEDAGAKS